MSEQDRNDALKQRGLGHLISEAPGSFAKYKVSFGLVNSTSEEEDIEIFGKRKYQKQIEFAGRATSDDPQIPTLLAYARTEIESHNKENYRNPIKKISLSKNIIY